VSIAKRSEPELRGDKDIEIRDENPDYGPFGMPLVQKKE